MLDYAQIGINSQPDSVPLSPSQPLQAKPRFRGQAGIKPVLTHKPFGYVKRLLYFKSKLNCSPVVFPAVQSASPSLAT